MDRNAIQPAKTKPEERPTATRAEIIEAFAMGILKTHKDRDFCPMPGVPDELYNEHVNVFIDLNDIVKAVSHMVPGNINSQDDLSFIVISDLLKEALQYAITKNNALTGSTEAPIPAPYNARPAQTPPPGGFASNPNSFHHVLSSGKVPAAENPEDYDHSKTP